METYSNLSESQINHFLEINKPEHADKELKAILLRIKSTSPMNSKIEMEQTNSTPNRTIEGGNVNIDKSVQLMFPKYNL